jgi:Kef-type K+ transport system membrane component KefB
VAPDRTDRSGQRRGEQLLMPLLIGGALIYAVATQLIGLHLAIGAFLFGAALPRESAARGWPE